MELNYKRLGSGQPFLVLHGLFGSLDNWITHGRKLADYFDVFLIDQRNHGNSDWSDDFSYDIMAEDLHEFVEKHQLENFILLGHSMGGKTALRYAQLYPDKIDKLISVDMGVKSYPITHDTILEGLKSIDLTSLKSRGEAEEQLKKHVDGFTVRQFLLKNLHRQGQNEFNWKINIPVLDKKLPEIVQSLPKGESLVETLFIGGGKSDYILPKDHDNIREYFPLAEFFTIENAGHWIHAEAPEQFIEKVLEFSLM